jgi:DNA-directed RNA polymerase specialized sigma24 family protein
MTLLGTVFASAVLRPFVAGEMVARSKIILDAAESRELQRRIKATTVAVRDRQRAEIIVLSATGISQDQIASRIGVSRVTVSHWRQRFVAERLAG